MDSELHNPCSHHQAVIPLPAVAKPMVRKNTSLLLPCRSGHGNVGDGLVVMVSALAWRFGFWCLRSLAE